MSPERKPSKRFLVTCAAALMAVSLGACTTGGGPKQGVGTLGGAVLGGLAGSQIGGGSGRLIATGIGAVLGAGVGAEIGASLDRADRLYAQRTTHQALEYEPAGRRASWSNPDSGNYGYVTPTRTYESYGGYCREYQTEIYVGGRRENGYGTACRQPDGSWEIVG